MSRDLLELKEELKTVNLRIYSLEDELFIKTQELQRFYERQKVIRNNIKELRDE